MTLERVKYIFLTVSVLCAGALSCLFILMGVRMALAGGLFSPPVALPLFWWGEWGVCWGGFCGWLWGKKLFRALGRDSCLDAGMRYGLYAGLMIGTVNAALTGTLPFGFVLGIFLGPAFGVLMTVFGKKMLARISRSI